MQITGNTFLVTGGASGLGAACARRLILGGANVVIADIHAEAGDCLANELGRCAAFAASDISSTAGVQAAIAAARDRFGGLRGVVNCAGILEAARVVGREGLHSLEQFERVIRVNLIGTFNVLRLAAQVMAESEPDANGERGVIVNTSSVAAFEGQIGQAAYSASKGGVASMTLPLARELAGHGIRVVAIAPGVFHTPMIAASPEKVQQSLKEQTVFPPRWGQPDEFAALAQHIIENPMLNGCVLRLDGAMRMRSK